MFLVTSINSYNYYYILNSIFIEENKKDHIANQIKKNKQSNEINNSPFWHFISYYEFIKFYIEIQK